MRASRASYDHAIRHQRSAVLFVGSLDLAERFALAQLPRPAIRGVEAVRRDRPHRKEVWFKRGKRS